MKRCSKCRIEKEVGCFSKDKSRKDWLSPQCKICRNEFFKKPEVKEYQKKYQQIPEVIERRRKRQRGYRKRPEEREHLKEYSKEYQQRPEVIEKRKKDRSKKYKNDPLFKLAVVIRTRLRNALKGNFKTVSAVQDLGCSIEELKLHLESQFQERMTWENWKLDGWHIDHIIPLDSFDLTNREQFLKACHYTNLQPLWAKENILKSNKI